MDMPQQSVQLPRADHAGLINHHHRLFIQLALVIVEF